MVVIRLSRGGTNKRPFYHVVVADQRRARDGRYLERLGFYNPIASGGDIYLRLNTERLAYWTQCGAQASERVQDLIKEFNKIGEVTGTQYQEKMAGKIEKEAKRKAAKKAKAATPAAETAETTEGAA